MNNAERRIALQRRALQLIDLDDYHVTKTGSGRVARHNNVTPSIAPTTIGHLLIAGWIEVSPDPPAWVTITEAGRAELNKSQ